MDELDPRLLEAWAVEPLAEDFEDRVMRRWSERTRPRPRRRRWPVALALAGAAALAVWWVVPQGAFDGSDDGGSILGDQVVVRPDEGTTLHTASRDGWTVITQREGGAEYRVESGTAVRVETPAATISVHGTAFRVEVETVENMMGKRAWGVSGAVLAGTVAVYVSVVDGAVAVDNEHGEVRLKAGESAVATDATAPTAIAEQAPIEAVAAVPSRRVLAPNERAAMLERIDEALKARARAAKAKGGEGSPADDEAAEDEPRTELPKMKLDEQYIREVIGEQLVPVAKECYDDALTRNPALAGELVMEFTIAGDEEVGGIVETAALGEGTELDDEALRECVIESLLNVAFDPPSGGGRVEVSYPIAFEPGNEGDGGQ